MPFDTKKDGGPAYPSTFEIPGGSFDPIKGRDVPVGHTESYIQLGMSLRDYFAAHAPITWSDAIDSLDCTGECVGPWPGSKILERLVLLRTDYADDMLQALKQPTK